MKFTNGRTKIRVEHEAGRDEILTAVALLLDNTESHKVTVTLVRNTIHGLFTLHGNLPAHWSKAPANQKPEAEFLTDYLFPQLKG